MAQRIGHIVDDGGGRVTRARIGNLDDQVACRIVGICPLEGKLRANLEGEGIAAITGMDLIGTRRGVVGVVAGIAGQDIVTVAAHQDVVTAAAINRTGSRILVHLQRHRPRDRIGIAIGNAVSEAPRGIALHRLRREGQALKLGEGQLIVNAKHRAARLRHIADTRNPGHRDHQRALRRHRVGRRGDAQRNRAAIFRHHYNLVRVNNRWRYFIHIGHRHGDQLRNVQAAIARLNLDAVDVVAVGGGRHLIVRR